MLSSFLNFDKDFSKTYMPLNPLYGLKTHTLRLN